jgi:5-methylcytosine-specific restriction endonuclease McrA
MNETKRVRDLNRYYAKREEILEQRKEYYSAHRSQILAQKQQYYAKHKEHKRLYDNQYYQSNREKRLTQAAKYQQEHPDAVIAVQNKRRAQKLNSEGSYTLSELTALFEQQEGFCFYCSDLLYASFDNQIHVEHKTPLSRGGSNSIDNIALSCAECNLKKHTMTAEEFLKLNVRGN